MAEPLPPPRARRARPEPPPGRAARRSLAALALLGAGALLVSCAAGTHGAESALGRPQSHRVGAAPAARQRAGAEPGAGGPALPPAQPVPVRALAVAYPAPTPTRPAPGGRALPRAGAALRRPHPAPGRPAAPLPRQRPARTGTARGLPPQWSGICDLGTRYGGWPRGSAQEAACHAVYG